MPESATATPAIRTEGLSKDFGTVRAVDGLDLTVDRGVIYALVGRCGSGKSTVAHLLLGLVLPTVGEVEVLGRPMHRNATDQRARIGYLPDALAFYPGLSVRENLEVQRRLLGLRTKRRIDEVLEAVGLLDRSSERVRALSGDEQQRLGLARALLHEPELLILDEPAQRLDAVSVRMVREIIERLAVERQVTVFVCDQDLGFAEKIATRIGVLHRGKLVQDLSSAEVHERSRDYLEIVVSDPGRAAWLLEERLGIGEFTVLREGIVRVYEGLDRRAEINRCLAADGLDVTRLALEKSTLEDYFVNVTEAEGVEST